MNDLVSRFAQNPILKPSQIRPSMPGMKVECLLNPGVFEFQGRICLLLRVAERPEQTPGRTTFPILRNDGSVEIMDLDNADPRVDLTDPRVIRFDGNDYLTTLSHLRLVTSDDGLEFRDEGHPPLAGCGDLETFGIEDCRVARIGDTYYLTFTEVSANGVGVGLRSTRDWRAFEAHGMIFPPHNKDCALFEEQVAGRFWALHRPSSPAIGGNYIWLAESPDLRHWGNHRCVARSRPGNWDSARVGAGAAPIRTGEGWLVIYHGADERHRYCLGAMLLDLERPWEVLARAADPIMEPTARYEREGFFGNVVFTNGHLVRGDTVTLYYGASDSVICAGTVSIRAILERLAR